jgi:hypothetical protein
LYNLFQEKKLLKQLKFPFHCFFHQDTCLNKKMLFHSFLIQNNKALYSMKAFLFLQNRQLFENERELFHSLFLKKDFLLP